MLLLATVVAMSVRVVLHASRAAEVRRLTVFFLLHNPDVSRTTILPPWDNTCYCTTVVLRTY